MKKLLAIVVLGLLFSGNANSDSIYLKKKTDVKTFSKKARCTAGNCVNGKGALEYHSKSGRNFSYEGYFLNRKFHGEGVLRDHTRDLVWSGIWKHGKFVQGKSIIKNNDNKEIVDKIKIPVTIHILKFSEHDFKTITKDEDVKNDIERANQMWRVAGIQWVLKEINYLKPNLRGFKKNKEFMETNCDTKGACMTYHLKEIRGQKQMSDYRKSPFSRQRIIYKKLIKVSHSYRKDSLNVYYLPKMLGRNACGIAWSPNPNSKKTYSRGFVLMGHKCGYNDRSRTLAHELGHLLDLKHVSNKDNLMSEFGSLSSKLEDRQIGEALFYINLTKLDKLMPKKDKKTKKIKLPKIKLPKFMTKD